MGYHKRARRLGITSEVYKQQRKLTARYIADFARWIRAQGSLPANDRIIEHHAQMCEAGDEIARDFLRMFPCLESELREDPSVIDKLYTSKDTRILVMLSARVLKRSRACVVVSPAPRPKGKPGRRPLAKEETNEAKIAQQVEAAIPEAAKLIAVRRNLSRRVRRNRKRCEVELHKIGFSIEMISVCMTTSNPVVAARHFIVSNGVKKRDYDIVAEYHRSFNSGARSG